MNRELVAPVFVPDLVRVADASIAPRPAPALGADTDAVLDDLGAAIAEIEASRAYGVIRYASVDAGQSQTCIASCVRARGGR